MFPRQFCDRIGVLLAVGDLTAVEVAPASNGAHRGRGLGLSGPGREEPWAEERKRSFVLYSEKCFLS